MNLKKVVLMLILVLLSFSTVHIVSADGVTRVYSGINTYTQKSVDIPIKIENNKGLMGYKFTINGANVKIIDVISGEAYSDGIFNYKISDNGESVEIIWTNSVEIKTDGDLFTIKADVKDNKKECKIELNYSPSDTINANYDEVSLACDLITIMPVDGKNQETTSNTFYDNQEKEDLVLDYLNGVSSDEAKDATIQTLIVIGEDLDVDKEYTIDELKTIMNELTEDKSKSFIKQFNLKILEKNPDLPAIPEKDGVAIVEEILVCTEQYTIKSATKPTEPNLDDEVSASTFDESVATKDSVGNGWMISVSVIVVILTSILVIFSIKKRRLKNES